MRWAKGSSKEKIKDRFIDTGLLLHFQFGPRWNTHGTDMSPTSSKELLVRPPGLII